MVQTPRALPELKNTVPTGWAHLGLEPIDKGNNVRVFEFLQHLQFIVDHALVSAHIFLQDDLDCHLFAIPSLCLANDSVGAGPKGSAELVEGPGEEEAGEIMSIIVSVQSLNAKSSGEETDFFS